MLQNYLTENDRIRKRQLLAFGFAFLALSVLYWIGYRTGQAGADLQTMLVWIGIAMVVAICYGGLALALYINRTTARLLKTLALIS